MSTLRLARGLTLGLVLAASAAAADDSVARIEKYLGPLKTLRADFVQVVRDREGQITSRATGTLSIARPDRFRWDYRQPYVQTIVADGRKLWLYDSDLEQVSLGFNAAGELGGMELADKLGQTTSLDFSNVRRN